MRGLWALMYRGDLRFGIRDMRWEAEQKGWPRINGNQYTKYKDRNSWISNTLRKSFYTQAKKKDKAGKSDKADVVK